LNLSHVSQRGSSKPWEKVAMADFALMNLDGGKNLAMNCSSTSPQVLRLLFGCDCVEHKINMRNDEACNP